MATASNWERKEVLITVKAYPMPARQGVEVSCTAGITTDGEWIRLYPIPYRFLEHGKRFRKYQRIAVNVQRSSDPRRESYKIDVDTIEILAEPLPPRQKWEARKHAVEPFQSPSLCYLQRERKQNGYPTLGFFRPREITAFEIKPEADPEWTTSERARLDQYSFFDNAPPASLEKIPYKFYYRFECDDDSCMGHRLSCHDWEIAEAYRRWSKEYGPSEWEEKFRHRFECEMLEKNDTRFYVGTIRIHPDSWIIVGLFYPRK